MGKKFALDGERKAYSRLRQQIQKEYWRDGFYTQEQIDRLNAAAREAGLMDKWEIAPGARALILRSLFQPRKG